MEKRIIKRKNLRIPKYNYSSEGLYFITICTKNRRCILSQINYDSQNEMVNLDLLNFGKIVEKYIKNINNTYDNIIIDNYVIMPNHIHFICLISSNNRDKNSNPSNHTIPLLISTFKRLTNKECNVKMWQRNYYEHIIRNEKEYIEIINYIYENPQKWNNDIYFDTGSSRTPTPTIHN